MSGVTWVMGTAALVIKGGESGKSGLNTFAMPRVVIFPGAATMGRGARVIGTPAAGGTRVTGSTAAAVWFSVDCEYCCSCETRIVCTASAAQTGFSVGAASVAMVRFMGTALLFPRFHLLCVI